MDLTIIVVCGLVAVAAAGMFWVIYLRKEKDEFRQITFALTKLICKAIIFECNGRTAMLSRITDILGGVFSDSGIEKADNLVSITKIRKQLEHLLTIDKIR